MVRKVILFLYILSLLVSIFFVEKNRFFLAGEYLFSFDYSGHVQNIIADYILNPDQSLNLARCDGCPLFYNTPWYKLWMLNLLGSGSLIGLHPFIQYIFITIVSQILFLYLLLRVISNRVHPLSFLISALVFIAVPFKMYLMPSASQDGVIQGLMVGAIAIMIYFLKNVARLTFKKIILISISFGLILATFLNISIGYTPVILYGLGFISLLFIQGALRSQFKYTILFFVIAGAVVFAINLPFVISQYLHGDSYYVPNFNPVSFIDSFTIYSSTVGETQIEIFGFWGIVILLFFLSRITFKNKIILLITYLILGFLITGGHINNIYLYDFIFNHFPFMNYMRSLYRFITYQLLIVFIIIYFGLKKLLMSPNIRSKYLAILTSAILVLIISNYIYSQKDMFQTGILPNEYFETASYLSNKTGEKIYLPFYMPPGNETMSGNFNWLPDKPRLLGMQTIHNNPFSSLISIPKLISQDGYPLKTIEESQFRALLSYNNSPTDIANFLSYMGVKYLILDKNYFWDKNIPDFKIDQFSNLLFLDKRFGNIYTFKLTDRSKECKPSYGDFMVGYCNDVDHPLFLINKTKKDYILDNLVRAGDKYVIERNNAVKVPEVLVNSNILEEVINNKILIPFKIYQLDNRVDNVFIKDISKGEYTLLLPILTNSSADKDKIFAGSSIKIKLNGNTIQTISPFSVYHGITWEQIDVRVGEKSTISIGSDGQGFVVVGNPLLLDGLQFQEINKESDNLKIRTISTYGPPLDDLEMKINNIGIRTKDKYNSNVEVDLLDNYYNKEFLLNDNYKEYVDLNSSFPQFTTTNKTNNIDYNLYFNKKVAGMKFIIGSAFLDSDSLGKLEIFNKYNKLVYQNSIYKSGQPLVYLPISTDDLSSPLKVHLEINKLGVLLYRYVLQIQFTNL